MVETALGSAEEVSSFLKESEGPFRVVGSGSKEAFRIPGPPGTALRVAGSGIAEIHAEDQVAVIRAGTALSEVQAELAASGQVLPLPNFDEYPALAGFPGTIGGAVSMNLPHAYFEEYGGWRDWVLGLTAVLADGSIVSCGSRAVKNVAGYDLNKLFVGARGTLGVITEVILKTYPLRAFERAQPTAKLSWKGSKGMSNLWIQRVAASDYEAATSEAGGRLRFGDARSSTIWAAVAPTENLRRFDGDWVLRSDSEAANLEIKDPVLRSIMSRIKGKLDPHARLNPGEFGFL